VGKIKVYTSTTIDDPYAITAGSDGALWFTNPGNGSGGRSVGRITTSGVVSSYPTPGGAALLGIAAGSDGALWFTGGTANSIWRMSTSGVFNEYTNSTDINEPVAITAGPDGALWFTNTDNSFLGNSIGRITTSGVVSRYVAASINNPTSIAVGPDGALWFTNSNNSIGRITTGGVVTNYTDPTIKDPLDIAAGPDGAMWFTNRNGFSIGQISPTNYSITSYPISGDADGIAAGPDGALWFTSDESPGSIERITASGKTTSYPSMSISGPTSIASGPDGNLWFTSGGNNSIGRITTAHSVTTSPTQGLLSASVTVSGAGFASGETVNVVWLTGLPSPKSLPLCSAVAKPNGTYACSATVPASPGGAGTHTVKAVGSASKTKAQTLFLLTT
jgi:virginiamycin B lyase